MQHIRDTKQSEVGSDMLVRKLCVLALTENRSERKGQMQIWKHGSKSVLSND